MLWAINPVQVKIKNLDAKITKLIVPKNISGKTPHVLLKVTDDDEPKLNRYRRLIIKCE